MFLEALHSSRLQDMAEISGSEAGFHFLLTLRTDVPQETVIARARSKSIKLVPLSAYYYGDAPEHVQNIYVMNFSSLEVSRAEEICKRLYACCG